MFPVYIVRGPWNLIKGLNRPWWTLGHEGRERPKRVQNEFSSLPFLQSWTLLCSSRLSHHVCSREGVGVGLTRDPETRGDDFRE